MVTVVRMDRSKPARSAPVRIRTVFAGRLRAYKDGSWQAPSIGRDRELIPDPTNWRLPMPLPRQSAAVIACLLIIASTGCVDVRARDARLRNAIDESWERVEANRGLNVSLETGSVLARLGLLARGAVRSGQGGACPGGTSPEPTASPVAGSLWPSCLITSAWRGRRESPVASLAWYRDAAALAALALADPAGAGRTRPWRSITVPWRGWSGSHRQRTSSEAGAGKSSSALKESRFAAPRIILTPSGSPTCAWRATIGSRGWTISIGPTAWVCR